MNLKLLEYALASLGRQRVKHIFILIILTLMMTVAMSIFTITSGLKTEAKHSLNNLPDILVQKLTGGRQQYIHEDSIDDIIIISGVNSATPRVWGHYYFEYLNTNLNIVGVDSFDPNLTETILTATESLDLSLLRGGEAMLIGKRFQEIITQIYGKDEFSFQKPDGEYITLKTAGVLSNESQMISTDTILTDVDSAREILGIADGYCADFAINVSNQQEISTVAEKIQNLSPAYRVITKEVIQASYQNMFDYKGGIFLLFFISCLLTFFMIVFDKLSGLSGAEAKEVAIMKSVGWSTPDVLKVKIYEAVVIAFTSYISSILLSLVYVYLLKAPGLKNIFLGYAYLKPHFDIPFSLDMSVLVSVFFVTVPLYIAAVIIPSWRAAKIDPGEVIR